MLWLLLYLFRRSERRPRLTASPIVNVTNVPRPDLTWPPPVGSWPRCVHEWYGYGSSGGVSCRKCGQRPPPEPSGTISIVSEPSTETIGPVWPPLRFVTDA